MIPHRLAESLPIVSILSQLRVGVQTWGVDHQYIYDLTKMGDFNSTLDVSAMAFHVDCTNIPGLSQSNSGDVVVNGTVSYSFHVHPEMNNISITPG